MAKRKSTLLFGISKTKQKSALNNKDVLFSRNVTKSYADNNV